jgi:hypothetical protein
MGEKISRDVRITTIYEGTSEIMEMTISRDRWQEHLKTRGEYYHEQARKFEVLAGRHPEVGANIAALALHTLAEIMERARASRLTRHQHILLRVGELDGLRGVRWQPGAPGSTGGGGRLHENAQQHFDRFALVVGCEGQPGSRAEMAALDTRMGLAAIYRAQMNLGADMDYVADVLYNRTAKGTAKSSEAAAGR